MSMDYSDRIERVTPSATVAISNAASELEAEGIDVIDLSVGEPDFPTPQNVIEAGKEAIDAGHTGYAPSPGVPELREEIAAKLQGDGLEYEAENVLVTPGGKQALYELFQTLVDDGEEVVLLDPAWVSYEAMTKLAGGSISRVDLAPHDFALEPALEELAATVSDETSLLVVNSPSNPTGKVYSEAALEGVRDLAVEHDITTISDEIYTEITYGTEARSLGSLPGMGERTITLNGFSKAYSMTGWRLGYFAGPEELVSQAGKLHSHSVTCATHFVQYAGIEALRNTDEAVSEMREAFEDRRDLLCDRLAEEGIDVPRPEGAFYLMLPVGAGDGGEEGSGVDDQAWCERAIEEAHVATVPGSAFGTPGYARLSYAASADRLEAAIDRLVENDLL